MMQHPVIAMQLAKLHHHELAAESRTRALRRLGTRRRR
jgi:hypothetical protein